jgi:hypothetical protein
MKNLLKATILGEDNKRITIVCRKTEATAHRESTYSWYILADDTDTETSSPLKDGLTGAKDTCIAAWGRTGNWDLRASWL